MYARVLQDDYTDHAHSTTHNSEFQNTGSKFTASLKGLHGYLKFLARGVKRALFGSAVITIAWASFFIVEYELRHNDGPKYNPADFACDGSAAKVWCERNNTLNEQVSQQVASLTLVDGVWTAAHARFKMYARASHIINFYVVNLMTLCYIGFGSTHGDILKTATTLLQYIFVFGLSQNAVQWAKHFANRMRPCYHFGLENLTEAISKDVHHNIQDKWVSFFSGDTASVWAGFFSLLFFTDIVVEKGGGWRTRGWRTVYVILAAVLACAGSVLRIAALMHWLTDVLVAVAVVLASTVICYGITAC
jgi:membrane-associated phospholipid phosphatase